MQDPIADMTTRIRNAEMVGRDKVSMPASKVKLAIARVLKDEGYIANYNVEGEEKKPTLVVFLKYHNNKPVIEHIKRVSRPGLRVYKNCSELPNILGGMGISIVSTSKGVMSDKHARKQGLGGEVLCEVW
jgi:small subunit ribosomal protein S8